LEALNFIERHPGPLASKNNETNLYSFKGLIAAATPYAKEALEVRAQTAKGKKKRLESKKPKLVVNNPEKCSPRRLVPTRRFLFAQAADRLPSPSRWRFTTMTSATPNKLSERSLTRMSNEAVRQQARAGAERLALQHQGSQRPSAIAVGHGAAHVQGDVGHR
jgi:hypothetical protein